jgi:hypothetical protein
MGQFGKPRELSGYFDADVSHVLISWGVPGGGWDESSHQDPFHPGLNGQRKKNILTNTNRSDINS